MDLETTNNAPSTFFLAHCLAAASNLYNTACLECATIDSIASSSRFNTRRLMSDVPSGVDGAAVAPAVAGDAFGFTVLGGMTRAIREQFARGVVTIEADDW